MSPPNLYAYHGRRFTVSLHGIRLIQASLARKIAKRSGRGEGNCRGCSARDCWFRDGTKPAAGCSLGPSSSQFCEFEAGRLSPDVRVPLPSVDGDAGLQGRFPLTRLANR